MGLKDWFKRKEKVKEDIHSPDTSEKQEEKQDINPVEQKYLGKWAVAFTNPSKAKKISRMAMEEKVTEKACYTDDFKGMIYFYVKENDPEEHMRIIQFLLRENLVPKAPSGKYCNFSFQPEDDVKMEEKPKLSNYIDLKTGNLHSKR